MKIGTIGTGSIVEAFLSGVNKVDSSECVAVYSRKLETGRNLADKFLVNKVYTDLDEMLDDTEINFIYVASPNSLHYEYALKALRKNKNVICEKPFVSNLKELETLINTAKEKNLMLFEAITTIHLPNYKILKDHINKIGQLRMIQCNYSQYSSRYDALLAGETPNVFSPKFSGGALQDINIYNLHFTMNLFGKPDSVRYIANKHSNGIDTSGVLILKYPGFISECVGAKDTASENFVYIQGEKGFIHVNGANGCKVFTVNTKDETYTINQQEEMNALYYEMVDFADIYKNKDYKTCYELLDYSHSVMEVLVTARQDAGIVFDADLK